MTKLARSASGLRHLRWLREIAATLEAHLEHNYLLTEGQNDALALEIPILRARIERLHAAVKPYRDFLESEHVRSRAKQRVATHLVGEAERAADGELRPHREDLGEAVASGIAKLLSGPRISRAIQAGNRRTVALAGEAASALRALRSTLPVAGEIANRLDRAGSLLQQFNEEIATVEEPRRRPLKAAVERAISEAREEIERMDARLAQRFPPSFLESYYPELTRGNTLVADDDDEDDDATAPPDART